MMRSEIKKKSIKKDKNKQIAIKKIKNKLKEKNKLNDTFIFWQKKKKKKERRRKMSTEVKPSSLCTRTTPTEKS
jgi:hypothetical protein